MKKLLILPVLALLVSACGHKDGEVTIHLPENYGEKSVVVSHLTIDNMFSATRQEDLEIKYDTLEVKDGVAYLPIDKSGASRYEIESPVVTRMSAEFYAAPGEKLEVTVKSFDPLDYTVKGSPLMEDLMAFKAVTVPIQQEYLNLITTAEDVTEAEAKAIMDRYDAAVKKFVKENPKSHVVPFVIPDLSGDDFKALYDKMTAEAKESILMPYAIAYNRQVEKMVRERDAEAARHAKMSSGTVTAPGFTLPDLNGRKVSLSDYKGRWVVLDFWGSWCGWCIKGFPALKKAYADYGDKIVIIGIDCNESEAEWRAGVKAHDLPWLQLYNGNESKLYTDYNIEGFPTKVIINPEGKIVDVTTGEDPAFFTRLAEFVRK